MKLATLRDGSRDGRLVVVDRRLTRALKADAVTPTLQMALDRWSEVEPGLRALSRELDNEACPAAFPFDPASMMAPLPRAFGFIDSSVYLNHMELARALRGSTVPDSFRREPLMSLRLGAPFLASGDDLPLQSEDMGLDLEAEVAVIVDDVPAAASRRDAERHIRLVTLVNDTSLRTVLAKEFGEGRSAYLGKAPAAMAPVAVTPDELGAAWSAAKLARPLEVLINGRELGRPNAGVDASFDFADLVSHASSTRPLMAGTIVAAGTVSNRDQASGSACIAERRMIETRDSGEPRTPYLADGDRVRIEMFDEDCLSIFGAIDQRVRVRSAAPA